MDPTTMAMAGAGIGAMMDKDEPLRGAALGGMGGYMGGAALGANAGGAYGALPGMAAPSAQTAALASQAGGMGMAGIPAGTQGAQAAMLASQTGAFGPAGLLATGEAAASAPGMGMGMMPWAKEKAFNMGKNLAFGGQGDSAKMIKAGQAMGQMGQQQQQQQQQRAPMIAPAPQINPNAGGSFQQARNNDEERLRRFSYGQPSLLPSLMG
jgi:hypothetical protein